MARWWKQKQHARQLGYSIVEISTNAAVIGGKKYIFCVCRNVTARREMEKELRAAKEKAEASNKELEHAVQRANQLAREAQAANGG